MTNSDGEDIPSDFFDDFTKDDFIEGLSVIDSWDDNEKPKTPRLNVSKLDSVRDLRDLIRRESDEKSKNVTSTSPHSDKRSNSDRINIKPGSRRDPNKTSKAIKKDKEQKVKDLLAKKLVATDDLRPPGTELDDIFDPPFKGSIPPVEVENIEDNYIPPPFLDNDLPGISKHDSVNQIEQSVQRNESSKHRESSRQRELSRHRESRQKKSPRHRESPRYHEAKRKRVSPRRKYESAFGESSRHRQSVSPVRFRSDQQSRHRLSPNRHRASPPRHRLKLSPQKYYSKYTRSHVSSQLRRNHSRSRSPYRRRRRSLSRSASPPLTRRFKNDDFLYPEEFTSYKARKMEHVSEAPYGTSMPTVSPMDGTQIYTYPQVPTYSGFDPSYDLQNPPVINIEQPRPLMDISLPMHSAVPVHIPMQTPLPVPAPIGNPNLPVPSPVPSMVPPPQQISPSVSIPHVPKFLKSNPESSDALAKLVADGILSLEDYLKLAPNKGVSQKMDMHERVAVLNRCNNALSRLGNLAPPNKLFINNDLIGQEPKQIVEKFCSPLKRQADVEFHFTKYSALSVALQNKQILSALFAALPLKTIVKMPKKMQKDVKDAAVQTVKPFCDVCDIRDSINFEDIGTSVDAEYISTSVHTQVDEQDLISSKAMFNPTGSVADGAPISIAHMTPAQLVSQLAARAKTLKQADPPARSTFNSTQHPYDYEDRRDHGYRNNYNNRF